MINIKYRKYFLLFSVCCCMFGYSVNRYILVPIQDQLIEFYQISSVDYNLLQSLYSWPCSVTLIASGILVDNIGVNKMIFASFILTYIGMIITSISATKTINSNLAFIILCIGRCVIGMSNESMRISLKVFIIKQFKINKMGQILGIFIGSTSISSSINAIATYQIYVLFNSNIQIALSWPLVAYPIMSIPLFSYLISTVICNKNNDETDIEIKLKSLDDMTEHATLIESKTKKEFKLFHIKSFPRTYWLIVAIGSLFTVSYQTFNNIIVSFLHHTYSYSYTGATNLASIGIFESLFTLILCGWITDKYGIKCKLLLMSNMLLFLSYCIHQFSVISVNVGIAFLAITLFYGSTGFATTLFFSSIPIVLSDISNKHNIDFTGTGYGAYTSIVYTSIAIGYIIVGFLTNAEDGSEKYVNVVYFEMSAPIIGILLVIILWRLDTNNGSKLNLTMTSI
eukprot:11097_1